MFFLGRKLRLVHRVLKVLGAAPRLGADGAANAASGARGAMGVDVEGRRYVGGGANGERAIDAAR